MLSDKLITLLRTFNKYELNSLRKYIKSPFFNENEDIIVLFDIIDSALRLTNNERQQKELAKDVVWKKLFPKNNFQDALLRRLCSELLQLTYGYKTYKAWNDNQLQYNIQMLETLNDIQFQKHFNGVARQIDDLFADTKAFDTDIHLLWFQTELIKQQYRETIEPQFVNPQHLESGDFHLDSFYYSKKLMLYCSVLSYRNQRRMQANIFFPDTFLPLLEQSPYLEVPIVKVYYLTVLMLLDTQKESNYFDLKNYILNNQHFFSDNDARVLFTYLINYCISTKVNKGVVAYFGELLQLYKITLEKELFFEKGFLPTNRYKNIITVALRVNELDWTEKFIQNYTHRLPEGNQENALSYNLAMVYFEKKDYSKVIDQLREVEYENANYALGSKLILLKTYYELSEYKAMDALIVSFSSYLRRHKVISKELVQQYLNMLKFIKKLTNVLDKKSALSLISQIEKSDNVAGKLWLLEKAKQLEQRKKR